MNIAAWASKDEKGKNGCGVEAVAAATRERIDNEKRAVAWEEAEKSKHTARCKREEIKIQAWESQQKVKLEAEMRRIEAKVEQMRTNAQTKMVKKIGMSKANIRRKTGSSRVQKKPTGREDCSSGGTHSANGLDPIVPHHLSWLVVIK